MKSNRLFLVVAVLILPFLLAACGGDKVGNAEKFLKALGEGDAEEAQKYVCDKEKDSLDQLDSLFDYDDVTLNDISCDEDGDNVKCSYKLALEGSGEQDISVTYKMDGDKVCGTVE